MKFRSKSKTKYKKKMSANFHDKKIEKSIFIIISVIRFLIIFIILPLIALTIRFLFLILFGLLPCIIIFLGSCDRHLRMDRFNNFNKTRDKRTRNTTKF